MTSFVTLVGDLTEGYRVYGPFSDEDEANEWAEASNLGATWWVAPLVPAPRHAARIHVLRPSPES